MIQGAKIRVIIPAFNEEASIGKVIEHMPTGIDEVIVVNNGSTDDTVKHAQKMGATVLNEPRKGYGKACLTGIEYVNLNHPDTDLIGFVDGDFSDYPEQLRDLVQALLNNKNDLIIGSRALGKRMRGSMTMPQIFGNWLATRLIYLLYQYRFTDLGPMRVITSEALKKINMQDKDYGWTVEMQIKAAKFGLSCSEIPVDYRKRIGKSKVSGTVKGVFMAGYKILYTIFKYR